jgi:hypothetical protein
MSTDAQILANRRNALNSTGPRTEGGKSRSSANSTKHGLSARFRVLTCENQDDFDDLLADLTRTFAPTNPFEDILVMEMVQSHWRVARIRRIEADMIDNMAAGHGSSDHEGTLRSLLLNDHAGPWLVLQRHLAAAERTGYRALNQLLALRRIEAQAAREAAQPNEPNLEASTSETAGCDAPPDHAPPQNDPRREPIHRVEPKPARTQPARRRRVPPITPQSGDSPGSNPPPAA